MSKSKGNVVVPTEILDKFGADAVRWRAAMARPGPGLAVRRDPDEGRPPAGDEGPQRLEVRPRRRRRDRASTRSRSPSRSTARCSAGSPRWSPSATDAFEAYDYTTALETAEKFFWEFCDDYLELVKERAYDEEGGAATVSAKADPRDRPRRPAAAARAVPALRDRGGLVVVAATGLDPPRRLADRRRARLGRRDRRRSRSTRSPPPWSASAARSRTPRSRCAPSCPGWRSAGPQALVARRRARRRRPAPDRQDRRRPGVHRRRAAPPRSPSTPSSRPSRAEPGQRGQRAQCRPRWPPPPWPSPWPRRGPRRGQP